MIPVETRFIASHKQPPTVYLYKIRDVRNLGDTIILGDVINRVSTEN